jgi:hypothetical protein
MREILRRMTRAALVARDAPEAIENRVVAIIVCNRGAVPNIHRFRNADRLLTINDR